MSRQIYILFAVIYSKRVIMTHSRDCNWSQRDKCSCNDIPCDITNCCTPLQRMRLFFYQLYFSVCNIPGHAQWCFLTSVVIVDQYGICFLYCLVLIFFFKSDVFTSPELKAQENFSYHKLFVVRLYVCLFVGLSVYLSVCLSICLSVTISHFRHLQNHWANFN